MDQLMRQHGFFALFVAGAILLGVGAVWQPLAFLPGTVLVLVGALARPIEEVVLKDGRVKWQQEAIEKVAEKVQQRVGRFTADAVIRGEGAVAVPAPTISGQGIVVMPRSARLKLTTLPPTVIVKPQSAEEFAETLVERVIEPALGIGSSDGSSDPEVTGSADRPGASKRR